MRIEHDMIIFSTGKKMYVNCGIIGIGEDDVRFVVSGGYDAGIDEEQLILEERLELADYMCGIWQRWAVQ